MRNLITLTALTALSLLSASHAQSVRSAIPSRINTATALEPVTTEPLNTVIHPYTEVQPPLAAPRWCRWFKMGVPALPVGGWYVTTTYNMWEGEYWVLHCRAATGFSMAQPAKVEMQMVQDVIKLP
ncbi:hypothetical protein FNU79_15045 [Deinococcus detaillensis]|uniref:Uncharacterized protein n=1 Tax=Deinococcus detaillensis TaxID=2592048 RepID=A0A553UML0_9DEIO|nr:hypothetical protein [Deinococcus detaillensis]TSA81444.1 hypothetical protein FNU79_15045 [Deinococcus detaillensis]